MVMVNRTTLIARIDEFNDSLIHIAEFLQLHVDTYECILQVVTEIAVILFHITIRTTSIAVIVQEEHTGMILKEMVEICTDLYILVVPVESGNPASEIISLCIRESILSCIRSCTCERMEIT